MAADSLCYVGIWPCGCAQAAAVIDASTAKSRRRDAKFCAEVITDGGRIETQTVAWVREHLRVCRCDERPALPLADAEARA